MYLGDLLGVPYKVHGRSKEEGFDCYGLAIEVLRRYGIEMKDYLYDSVSRSDKSNIYSLAMNGIPHIQLQKAEIACIVLLEVHGEPWHVGVYIGNGKIIHCTRDRGVLIENLRVWGNRTKGYFKIK